jgi:hypothetical protein
MSDDNYYEDARGMFMTDGWKDFMAEVRGLESVCNLDACNSSDEFWFNKGKLAAVRVILGYEDMVLAAESQQD